MKKIYITISAVALGLASQAQCTADFESFSLSAESYWNGSDQSGGFEDGCIASIGANFSNVYDTAFGGYWSSGWAYSNETDVSTPGNQFSAFAGAGFSASSNYAVGQSYYGDLGIKLDPSAGFGNVSFYVTNSTYAAISMKDGDTYGKVFGDSVDAAGSPDGTNGEDWFLLKVYGYQLGTLIDSQEVYLADYRFADSTQDYILDTWQQLTLSAVDSLRFTLSSSDVGGFGMNTPAFLALDHLEYDYFTSVNESIENTLSFYPNPTNSVINISNALGKLEVYNMSGQLVLSEQLNGFSQLDVSSLKSGVYQMYLIGDNTIARAKLIKQ